MNKVECDECKTMFDIDIKIKKYKGGVEEIYFTCPKCEHKYISHFTNQSIRKKQIRIKKETNKINKIKLKKEIKKEIIKLTEEMVGKLYG